MKKMMKKERQDSRLIGRKQYLFNNTAKFFTISTDSRTRFILGRKGAKWETHSTKCDHIILHIHRLTLFLQSVLNLDRKQYQRNYYGIR